MNSIKHLITPQETPLPCELSLVVPIYNEYDVLPMFHRRAVNALEKLTENWEIVYIDDGSTDASFSMLKQLRMFETRVGLVHFSRNFGKENAMCAGLNVAKGKAVVIIDADLQDPPELIEPMLDAWRQGADVVNMKRASREGESLLKRVTSHGFYRVINKLSDVKIQEDVGDFRLLSRRAVDALNRLGETNRFMKGLFSWVGFNQVTLDYHRSPRAAGYSKWNYWKLWNFAIEGVTGFSTAPLKVATYAGFLTAISTFVYAFYFLVKTMVFGELVAGFPTLIITILLLGGLQLMAIGVVGEYLGRMFIESKKRPLYVVEEFIPPGGSQVYELETNREVLYR